MSAIPNIFHFVFGLGEQTQRFHLMHYLCLASCRPTARPVPSAIGVRLPGWPEEYRP